MAQQQWQRVVSAGKPVSFGSAGSGALTRLELRGCCLKEGSAGPGPTLFCSVAGGSRLALARPSQATPYCQVRLAVDSDAGEAKFSCEGAGEILVVGVVTPLDDLESLGLPPAKKARVEAPKESPRASPKASPAAPAAAGAASAGAAKPASPKLAAKASASPVSKPSSPKAAPKETTNNGKTQAEKPQQAEKPKQQPEAKAKAKSILPYGSSGQAPQQPAPAKAAAKEEKPGPTVTHRALASGLKYEVLKVGNGPQAKLGKKVKVRYEGRLGRTGARFDKGVIQFRLGMGEVIKGWDEGVKGMLCGEKRRLLVPSKLGYAAAGAPPVIPPHSDLVFEVELQQC